MVLRQTTWQRSITMLQVRLNKSFVLYDQRQPAAQATNSGEPARLAGRFGFSRLWIDAIHEAHQSLAAIGLL